MKNINKHIKDTTIILNNIINELDLLELEKKQILERYQNAKPEEKPLIEQEMIESEKKFENLYEAITALSDKVKKLKNNFTNK